MHLWSSWNKLRRSSSLFYFSISHWALFNCFLFLISNWQSPDSVKTRYERYQNQDEVGQLNREIPRLFPRMVRTIGAVKLTFDIRSIDTYLLMSQKAAWYKHKPWLKIRNIRDTIFKHHMILKAVLEDQNLSFGWFLLFKAGYTGFCTKLIDKFRERGLMSWQMQ